MNNYGHSFAGSDHENILSTKLESPKQTEVVNFYNELASLVIGDCIAVIPFNHIDIKFGPVGLCVQMAGYEQYEMMGMGFGFDSTKFVNNFLAVDKNKTLINGVWISKNG
jgi:hypothetical protein